MAWVFDFERRLNKVVSALAVAYGETESPRFLRSHVGRHKQSKGTSVFLGVFSSVY